MLTLSGISKTYGVTRALIDVSIRIEAGEVLAIVGENGSGKSTLMKILAGEEIPDGGPLTTTANIQLVHQELAVCPHLSVAENIFLGNLGVGGFSPAALANKAKPILEGLGYPDLDPNTLVKELSISLQQVVEIARTQAADAEIILFDEPTSSLTRADIARLFDLIRNLKQQGKAIVYISHFLDEVREVSDRIVVLRDGEFVAEYKTAEVSDDQLITAMVGRNVSELFPRSPRQAGDALVTVENLWGNADIPKGASLSLHAGEVVGIAGLNGSGRSELLRAIFGLDSVRNGSITVMGNKVKPGPRWLQKLGFVSEDRKEEGLALNMSIAENATFPSRLGWFFNPQNNAKAATPNLQATQVKCASPEQAVGELSGGNQQKVAIARLLQSDCDVLILDEPTRGIDVGSKAEIYKLIDQLAAQGKAILMVSSYLPELLGVCDRVGAMSRGQLSELKPANETNAEQLMELCLA
ncbi:MAG TPA: sugar ABC transporter ATP-binding protein [Fimbriimonas sp.]|nr:sugar ABC transporter ATP-binding protein [Fimbriimonas sp.]